MSDQTAIDDSIRAAIARVDSTEIASAVRLKKERRDVLVTCASGARHLARFEDDPRSLLRQKWAYEQLRLGGVPCPRVEAFIERGGVGGEDCLLLEWIEAESAATALARMGRSARGAELCRELGKALRSLHAVQVQGKVPDHVFRSTRAWAREFVEGQIAKLIEGRSVDAAFREPYLRLLLPFADRIPDPPLPNLCFTDMHFHNVLVSNGDAPRAVAFVDTDEIGIGWPYWDFTNWEVWGLRFGLAWTREHILGGYGDVDLSLYRFALLVRLSHPKTLVGSARELAIRAVERQDIDSFDLDALYGTARAT